jgi:hypothetical protein
MLWFDSIPSKHTNYPPAPGTNSFLRLALFAKRLGWAESKAVMLLNWKIRLAQKEEECDSEELYSWIERI